jgi:outer membrane protein assembly factor BamB
MRLCLTVLASAALAISTGFAADWPQWRGPDRNEISKETGIRTSFNAKDSPKLLWTFDKAGSGYSGPAVVGNVLYCLGADEKEFAFAVDTETGKELWRAELGDRFKNPYGDGPRSTPTIDGDHLYCIRGGGDIHCLNTKDGSPVWHKSFTKDFKGKLMPPGWGFSESPLVDGDKVLCSPGGTSGTIIALNKNTGEVLWRCKDVQDLAAYSSIIAADVYGVHQYIQVTEHGVAGVKADDGTLLWFFNRPGQRVAVIPTPIYDDNHVYVTAGYGCGCALIKLSISDGKFKAEEVYANKKMTNHHGGVVLLDGYIYGGSDAMECQDLKTGEVKWKGDGQGRPKKPSVTCVDGHLFCYDERTGICYIIEASPKGYKETGQIKIPNQSKIRSKSGGIWTHPVIANGKLYLRDQDLLYCFDVKK